MIIPQLPPSIRYITNIRNWFTMNSIRKTHLIYPKCANNVSPYIASFCAFHCSTRKRTKRTLRKSLEIFHNFEHFKNFIKHTNWKKTNKLSISVTMTESVYCITLKSKLHLELVTNIRKTLHCNLESCISGIAIHQLEPNQARNKTDVHPHCNHHRIWFYRRLHNPAENSFKVITIYTN